MAAGSKKLKLKDALKIAGFAIVVLITICRYFDATLSEADIPEDDVAYSYHFIDVGQGDATMILGEDVSIVVDTGPGDHRETTVEYIKQFTEKIDVLILTHPHEDHIGAAADVINNIGVDTVIMPDATADTKCFEDLLDAIEENNCQVVEGKAGERFEISDVTIDIFAPNSSGYRDLNNSSIVARIKTGKVSALITGDAESSSEREILESFPAYMLDSDILKAGHHGSSTSSSIDFLDAVSPKYAVISCGEGNSYGHPHYETLQLLKRYNIEYFRTDIMGTVVFHSDGERIALSESYISGGDYLQS